MIPTWKTLVPAMPGSSYRTILFMQHHDILANKFTQTTLSIAKVSMFALY